MTKSSAWDFEHLHDLCGHEEVSGQHIPQNVKTDTSPSLYQPTESLLQS